jgi:acetyl-CoA carboxylase biotin carboxyl carrier protein
MDINTLTSDYIRKLAELLNETGLTEIEVEQNNTRIRIARQAASASYNVSAPTVQLGNTTAPVAVVEGEAPIAAGHPDAVVSPMVGNAYLSPKPGAAPFVKIGDRVEQGQTLLIVEAMKVMNPIPAPKSGVVRELRIKDSEPVEYNQVLAVIQ